MPKQWETHRTKCGRGRATYHPEWSTDQPWVTYIGGTAGRHCATLQDAHAYFHNKGMVLVKTPPQEEK